MPADRDIGRWLPGPGACGGCCYTSVIVFCVILTLAEILVIRNWKIFRKQ